MKEPIRKIAFLADKSEIKLIEEACLFGAKADKNLQKAVDEGGKFYLEFVFDELEDLAGYVANFANHEKSIRKQDKWDKLSDKIEGLLKLSENMSRPQKHAAILPKQQGGLKYYVFDTWLCGDKACYEDKKIIRKIQISGTKKLYNFAKVITKAFGFSFDHCFGFYDTLKDRKNCKKAFELFVDIGEEPTNSVAKGVKKTKISQAFKDVGEKMIFLFDYGDGWQFNVELKEIRDAEKGKLKPVILESIGKAPLQYPPCDEDEEAFGL